MPMPSATSAHSALQTASTRNAGAPIYFLSWERGLRIALYRVLAGVTLLENKPTYQAGVLLGRATTGAKAGTGTIVAPELIGGMLSG